MHEWSLAQAIFESVLDFAREKNISKIIEVEVSVGELSQLDINLMSEAFHLISKDTILHDTKIVFKEIKARFKCKNCGYEWDMKEAERQMKENIPEFAKIVDEEGTVDYPIHYMPDLIYAYIKCPACGSKDFEVVSGKGVKITKIIVEE